MQRSRSILALLAVILTACTSGGGASPSSFPASPAALTIFGAASLSGVLGEVKTAYEAANPGTVITLSTDSSSALATQIEQGAPADVFLSADTTNPKQLVDGGFATGDAVVFAGNKLCIVVPAGNPGAVASAADLAKAGLKVIAAGDEVPITKYATQLLANLSTEPGYASGFEAAYAANVVSREDNVKAVIAKIELGEGDAGIVYVTDAKASDQVETIDIPDSANVPASYAGVVVKASPNQPAATAFLDWFAGPDGQAILSTFGFLPPAT